MVIKLDVDRDRFVEVERPQHLVFVLIRFVRSPEVLFCLVLHKCLNVLSSIVGSRYIEVAAQFPLETLFLAPSG